MSWTWCQETVHLEVRPAIRGEGLVVKIDGGEAKSDRDWIYWRLPTVSTHEAFGENRCAPLSVCSLWRRVRVPWRAYMRVLVVLHASGK